MANIRRKMDFLYDDMLGEVQDLVARIEAVHAGIPGAADKAGHKINEATADLHDVLEDLSSRWSAARQFSRAHMLFSALGGAVIVIALLAAATFFSGSKGYWIAKIHHPTLVEAVEQTGVDVKALSTADLRARLSYTAEQGRLLVEIAGSGDPEQEDRRKAIEVILDWLRQLPGVHRWTALDDLKHLWRPLPLIGVCRLELLYDQLSCVVGS